MSGDTGRTQWGKARVLFLANLERVKAVVDEGWPLAHIYRENQNTLDTMSYGQFYHWARRYLSDEPPPARREKTPKPAASKPARPVKEPKGFVPGPRVPDPDDLF